MPTPARPMVQNFTSINYLTGWWDITTNVNIYNGKINTDNLTAASQDPMWSWFGKFNSNFKLPAKFSMQVSADLPVKNQPSGEPGR